MGRDGSRKTTLAAAHCTSTAAWQLQQYSSSEIQQYCYALSFCVQPGATQATCFCWVDILEIGVYNSIFNPVRVVRMYVYTSQRAELEARVLLTLPAY